MKNKQPLLGILMLAWSGAAPATTVLGAEYLNATWEYGNVDSGDGFRGFIGHRFDGNPFTIEAAYVDTGEAEIGSGPGRRPTLNFSGGELALGIAVAPRAGSHSRVWATVGGFVGESELRLPARMHESSNGFSMAAGLDWMWTPQLGLRLEARQLFGVKDPGENRDIAIFGAGLVFAFGGAGAVEGTAPAEEATREVSPPPLAEQIAEPTPEPAAAPAPMASPTPMFVVGASARLEPGAMARSRPTLEGSVLTMDAGTVLTLTKSVGNPTGRWWYVRAGETAAWVHENDLEPVEPRVPASEEAVSPAAPPAVPDAAPETR